MAIKTCQHCGAVHSEPAERCSFCDARFDDGAPARSKPSVSLYSRENVTPTDGALAMQPEATLRPYHEEWKQQVRERLRAYRVKHGIPVEDLQTALPFDPPAAIDEIPEAINAAPSPNAGAFALPHRPIVQATTFVPELPAPPEPEPEDDRVEIAVSNGRDAAMGVYHPTASERSSKLDALLPVAALPERRRAAAIDGALILFSFGAMLSIFWVLGGRLGIDKVDEIVTGVTLGLFYAQYFALFTLFGASTPGMMLCHLRVVSFNGGAPTSRQMLWRSFGYLISAGTCLLGFLWALWDEDHLCWHDRISQTYLSAAESPSLEARTEP